MPPPSWLPRVTCPGNKHVDTSALKSCGDSVSACLDVFTIDKPEETIPIEWLYNTKSLHRPGAICQHHTRAELISCLALPHSAEAGAAAHCLRQEEWNTCLNNNNNNNDNWTERHYSRFSRFSSLRRELSPTRTLKWPGNNLVQIRCKTQSTHHVQHIICQVVWRDSSAIKVGRVEIAFILACLAEMIHQWRRGGNWSTRIKPLTTSFYFCLRIQHFISSSRSSVRSMQLTSKDTNL